MKKTRFLKVLSLVLVLALTATLFAACGGGSADNGGSNGTPAGDNAASSGTVKDTLTVVTYNDVTGFFPMNSKYAADKTRDGVFIQNVYDTLFRLGDDLTPTPWLVTDYSVSEDGLEWTFTLRDDVYFHNGTKMTAEDVVFTWETALADNPAGAGSMLNGLAAAEYIDETHCKAIMSKVSPAFLNMLCTQMGIVVSKAYYEEVGGADGYAAHPIGTGAYKFVSNTSGDKMVLEANEEYWAGAPAIKHVEINYISNVSTQFIALESGDADVVINADLASCTRLNDNSIATWTETDSATRTLMMFGWANDYIRNDLNLRKAIQSALRKDDYLTGVLFGYGKVLDIDVVTGFPTSPEEGTYTVIPYDQDAAKDYLAKSNYDGRELEIYVVSGSTPEKVAQIVQGQLAEVGINVAVVPCDSATFVSAQLAVSADMMIYDNTNVWFDFCNPGATYNPDMVNMYSPDKYFEGYQTLKDYYAKIASEMDPVARKQLMADLMSYGNENVYQIGLYAGVSAIAYNKELKGINASPVSDFYISKISWN